MKKLTEQKCIPCKEVTQSDILTEEQIAENIQQIAEWKTIKGRRLRRIFTFKDFDQAIDFVNELAKVAKQQDHHPRIYIYKYNQVRIEFSTFSIGRRITINDFILAAKTDLIYSNFSVN